MPSDERWAARRWSWWVCHEGVVCLSARELCQAAQPSESIRIWLSKRLHVHLSAPDMCTLPFPQIRSDSASRFQIVTSITTKCSIWEHEPAFCGNLISPSLTWEEINLHCSTNDAWYNHIHARAHVSPHWCKNEAPPVVSSVFARQVCWYHTRWAALSPSGDALQLLRSSGLGRCFVPLTCGSFVNWKGATTTRCSCTAEPSCGSELVFLGFAPWVPAAKQSQDKDSLCRLTPAEGGVLKSGEAGGRVSCAGRRLSCFFTSSHTLKEEHM